MAKKTRYCPHVTELTKNVRTYLRSKSSKVICCRDCFLQFIRQEIVETQGEEFAQRLDAIKALDMSKAWPKFNIEDYDVWGNRKN